ncbi:MAG TPA: SgcJ/EcaC family oxidoreductase [Gemmataceae bacterium]|nr:SgcJ/EcaC family oxidoreductase [Gemmataceae bacterium]
MRTALILTASTFVLAAICFAAGNEPVLPKPAERAAKAAAKAVEKPVAQLVEKSAGKPAAKALAAPVAATDKSSADETAIRQTGESFSKAYGRGDAKAVAAHFTPDAEYVDDQGNVFQGRQAIEESLSAFFTENPGCQLAVDIDTIRFVSPGVAVEDGTTTVTRLGGAPPEHSHYTAMHVKTDGKWLTASARDHPPKGRRQHSEQLQQLAWLLGDWVDEGDDSIVDFSCQPVHNGNFLMREFTVKIAGEAALSGTQRIGWDPLTGKLQAWTFDSEGGYGQGTWHRIGESWVLKSTGVTADGQTASGTSVFTFVNAHTMTWQAVDHEIEGIRLPDSELFTLVRKPPPPM